MAAPLHGAAQFRLSQEGSMIYPTDLFVLWMLSVVYGPVIAMRMWK